jgi:hypothetical protein
VSPRSAQSAQPQRPPAGSVQSCVRFGVNALRHHVTVRTLPAACRGLSRAQVNFAVASAVRSVVGGLHGKALQRARAASLSPLLGDLVKQVPASTARPSAAPSASQVSRSALGLLALCFWCLTVGIGMWMMSRWFSRQVLKRLRRGAGQAGSLSPAVALGHFGLAVAGLLAWIGYLASGVAAVGWIAGATLLPTAGIGMTLVTLGPDRRRSALVIAAHIALAVATMLFTLLAVVTPG